MLCGSVWDYLSYSSSNLRKESLTLPSVCSLSALPCGEAIGSVVHSCYGKYLRKDPVQRTTSPTPLFLKLI